MIFVSGVYYPVSQLPSWLQPLAQILPLGVAVQVVRPLLLGQLPVSALPNIFILMSYCFFGFYLATILTRRRLLK
jgi:lipooligosaccharide transport system permease protein